LEARARRTFSVIVGFELVAVAVVGTAIVFVLVLRSIVRLECIVAGSRGQDDRLTGRLGLPMDVTVRWIVRTRGAGRSPPAAEDAPSSPSESAPDAAINTTAKPAATIRADRFFMAPTSLSDSHGRRRVIRSA